MSSQSMKLTLSQKLLTYIGHCQGHFNRKFSYEDFNELIQKYEVENYSIKTLRKEFSLLKKHRLIEFKTHYRKPYPILTTEGKLVISSRLPYKKFDQWDGKWRVVALSIPLDRKRARLGYIVELEKLGFKRVSRNIYITAHPLLSSATRLAKESGLIRSVLLFETSKIENEDLILEEVFKVDEINSQYKKFIARAKRQLDSVKSAYWPFIAKNLEFEFRSVYVQDPQLHIGFLPKDWMGSDAYRLYKEIAHSY